MIWVWAAIILWAHVGGQLFVSPYANRDVIVYVRRGAIEMPVNQTQANLDELSQIDSALYNFLVSYIVKQNLIVRVLEKQVDPPPYADRFIFSRGSRFQISSDYWISALLPGHNQRLTVPL